MPMRNIMSLLMPLRLRQFAHKERISLQLLSHPASTRVQDILFRRQARLDKPHVQLAPINQTRPKHLA